MEKRKGPPNRKENGALPINVIGDHTTAVQAGLTKREYFAGLAMQGIVTKDKYNDLDVIDIADVAVKISDAILDRLKSE